MKKVQIAEATATQLAEFATVSRGLDVNFRMGVERIRSALTTSGYDKDFIEIEGNDGPDPNARVAEEPVIQGRKRYVIRIPVQETPGSSEGKLPVPVGVNGKVYLIKRNEDVTVPEEVLVVLKNANKLRYDKGPNGEPINPTEVPTHPFSIVREIAA